MKKLLLFLAATLATSQVWAVNPQIVSASGTYFPSSNISYYLAAEAELVEKAKAFCGQFNESVETISNINVQIQGNFTLDSKNKTEAVTYPHYIYSALVHCRP